jgi:hypothetical protein
MNKKEIKNLLTKTFISEETTPGISQTKAVNAKSKKINNDGVKDIEKKVGEFEKAVKKDANSKQIPQNKFNYADDFQKDYHDQMEILNGQEMIKYDTMPEKNFTDRALEAIEGSARMGNQGGIGNAEATWGASSDDFGKNLVKRIKNSAKLRGEETPAVDLRGKDIQELPTEMKGDNGSKPTAYTKGVIPGKKLKENTNNDNNPKQIKESMKRLIFKNEFKGLGNALKLIPEGYKVDNKTFEMTDGNETYTIRWEGNLSEGKAVVLTAADKKLVNEDITRMKQLFGYKSQDTLGLVKGNARINENKAFGDIWSKTKALMTEAEEIESAKADEGHWEEETITSSEATKYVEGSASTDKGTEAPAAKEGDLNKAVKVAPEAKKHVEGSVSTDKGIEAPAPKNGNWDEAAISQAAEAKKHVHLKEAELSDEESEELRKKAEANDKEYSIAEEMDIMKEEPMDAEKMMEKMMAEAKHKMVDTDPHGEEDEEEEEDDDDAAYQAKKDEMNENVGEEEEEEEEGSEEEENDSWESGEADSSSEEEPAPVDFKSTPSFDDSEEDDIVVPTPSKIEVSLLKSPSSGDYFIRHNGRDEKVPSEFISIAMDKSKKGAERAMLIFNKMQAAAEMGSDVEADEYED